MELTLNPLFSSGCVLQRGKPLRVFGGCSGAAEGDMLTAEFSSAGGSFSVSGAMHISPPYSDGSVCGFTAVLPPLTAGGPYEVSISVRGMEAARLSGVMIGETLLCSGQSNMQMELRYTDTPDGAFPGNSAVPRGGLRMFRVSRPEGDTGIDGRWLKADQSDVGRWSAVGYILGCMINGFAGVPVGIVDCCQGASVIQSWMTREAITNAGLDLPPDRLFIDHSYYPFNPPQYLYDRMLRRALPFTAGCAVWYQGESNTSPDEARLYGRMLETLISSWRRDMYDDALPFLIMQIHNYECSEPRLSPWKAIQRAQKSIRVRSAMCSICDDMPPDPEIHPKNKYEYSRRAFEVWKALRNPL